MLVKANMEADGIYLVNIVDDYVHGRYLPSFIHTLRQAFNYVYLFSTGESWQVEAGVMTFVIIATDHHIDLTNYRKFVTDNGEKELNGEPFDEIELDEYLSERKPILLTDDYAPTDILVAPLIQ